MKTPNTSKLVLSIEKRYGSYVDKDLRSDVGRFLYRRFGDDEHCLELVGDAVNEYHEVRFGPPDVATIRKAISAYEEAYDGIIAPERRQVIEAPTEKEVEETRMDVKALARERGIDTNRESWAAQYFFAVMAEQKAKEAEDTKGRIQE